MSDLVAFLNARLGEDEANHGNWHGTDCAYNYPDQPAEGFRCNCGHPGRVFREIEAKRALLGLISENEIWPKEQMAILLAVAAVYSDHPDYDPAWKCD